MYLIQVLKSYNHINKIIKDNGFGSANVDFVENINKLDLDGIPASFNPLDSKLPMREDCVESKPQIAKDILKNAPSAEDNFFIVPKIIE